MAALRKLECKHIDNPSHAFFCPGCKGLHAIWTTGKAAWEFNGSLDKPTFRPSILIHGSKIQKRCHSFITDGKIQYLGDCEHELKNKIVDLPCVDYLDKLFE